MTRMPMPILLVRTLHYATVLLLAEDTEKMSDVFLFIFHPAPADPLRIYYYSKTWAEKLVQQHL